MQGLYLRAPKALLGIGPLTLLAKARLGSSPLITPTP